MKLNALALAGTGAILAAAGMLLLSVAANLGIYEGTAEMMSNAHMFYSTGVGGTIAGMIEAAVWSFVGLYVFAWLYNKMAE